MKMSRTKKEKLETYTDASLQLAAEDYIEVTLEKRKKDAKKPLYLKRI
jgi:hypothetical protein